MAIGLGITEPVTDYSRERDVGFLQGAAQSLQDENTRLRQEHAAWVAREAALQETLRWHQGALAEQEAEVERQAAEWKLQDAERQVELARLEGELAGLREQLDQRNQALYGRSTERRSRGARGSKPGRKPRKDRPGHGPTEQPDLPLDEVVHLLPESEQVCDACGGQMSPMGKLKEAAKLIALEKRVVVLETHLRDMFSCACGGCVKTAPGPLKLVAGGRYALSFTVHVAYQKYFAHMPLERQRQMFAHEGLRVSTAALFDQLDALATALATTYEAIWKVLQAERVLRADETPWAILSNGYTDNEPFYAWVVVGTNYVAFRFLDTRSKEGAATVLGTFAGTLMVDCMTSYPAAAKGKPGEQPNFLVANCHAHARRKFVESEKYWPMESEYAIDLYRQLYDIERAGKVAGADLGMLRDTRSRPLVNELFTWAKVQQQRPELLPSTGLYKALGYLLNHEAGFRVFLEDPEVPIDNNESERAVRPTVMGRVNYQGSRSRRGTEVQAILSTLVESAKRCGVSPEAYLFAAAEHALSKAGAVLLPDEFKRQLDAMRKPLPDTPSVG
jgi:transposase